MTAVIHAESPSKRYRRGLVTLRDGILRKLSAEKQEPPHGIIPRSPSKEI
jgi:hypothetical protein